MKLTQTQRVQLCLLTPTQQSWFLKFALAAGVKRQSGSKLLSGVGVFKPVHLQISQEQTSSHNSLRTPSTNNILPVTYTGLSNWILIPYITGQFTSLTLT